ncbi:hypothetical protein SAMN04490239_6455 [Rhodococcus koreensis]|uniref:Uncharacterized protein n=1 Tax=Rhodococcus koreensis TaxID=99653 RepID=A0A1H4XC70_9NOCA|nr:hypothetical protein SAMN04490239_6455 [Rhodococcus koreensis]
MRDVGHRPRGPSNNPRAQRRPLVDPLTASTLPRVGRTREVTLTWNERVRM